MVRGAPWIPGRSLGRHPRQQFFTGGHAKSFTVWSAFAADTEYFGSSVQAYMINLVVDDLDAALENVAAGGAEVLEHREEQDFGRFGWFVDPDGRRVELWEPPEPE